MPVKLHYQIYGEGQPLYLLHGLFGSNRNWLTMARQLVNAGQIIAIDLRNHGDSEHAAGMTYAEMAEDVAELACSLGHNSINLLGHSLGGKTAMVMALQFPSLLDRLVIVDIAPLRYNPKSDDLVKYMQALPVASLTSRGEASELLAKDIADPVLRLFLLQNLVKDKQTGFKWRINLEAIRNNYESIRDFPHELQQSQYHGPSLFVAGSHSEYVQPEHHKAITGMFPQAIIVTIEGAGHWVHADKPELVAMEVRNFLTQNPA